MRTLQEQAVTMDDFDALGEGREDFHLLHYDVTLGEGFGLPDGAILLARSRLYPLPQEERYVGVAEADSNEISNHALAPHEGDVFADLFLDPELDEGLEMPIAAPRSYAAYLYSAARALGNGFASRLCAPLRVDFDTDRIMITPALPMPPVGVFATPVSGGRFQVVWQYDPYGQGAWPTDFQVFQGTGGVDWGVPLTDAVSGLLHVGFDPLRRRYEFITPAYANGTAHAFGVRARNATGIAEANSTITTSQIASSSGPTAAKVVTAAARR